MKSRDFDSNLKPFLKVFEKLAYRHDVSTVFQDFILVCLNFMGNGNFMEERDNRMKSYSKDEHAIFNEMFSELVKLMAQEITEDGDWFDPFGNFYQAISGSHKASAMGQFFTPEPVVNMMAKMVIRERKGHFLQAEPCSGSGRMILASHTNNPMGFYWAVDLDGLCAQMTAVNMALHNCAGVVLHANGLWEEHQFFRAYHIARVQLDEKTFIPCIYPIKTYSEAREIFHKYQEFTDTYNMAYHFKDYFYTDKEEFNENKAIEIIEGIPEETAPEIVGKIIDIIQATEKINTQLSLF
jgi:type I restriction enzyme M protein